MNPELWRQVEELFHQVSDLAGDEQIGVLAAAPPEIRVEVERLLAADRSTALDVHASVQAEAAHTSADSVRGKRFGPWVVTGVLGRGGMGAVYRAERADDSFQKQVAIKVLRAGLDSEFAQARFRYERRILAGLEHPYIARLIDGGEVDEAPYIVMEYVEGKPITQYCADNHLGIDAILQLFRQVAEAVQAAHQQLIVHRDLKPSNILVTAAGTPKLLDFGIAKLEDPEVVQETAAETRTGMRLMTPEYASPEQVRGEPVTAASDVYSLGAVLFELLTGQKAQRVDSTDPLSAVQAVCETETARPSSVAPVENRRRLAGDIDNIVLKAMQKEPARRYATVAEFSADIGRHLEGRPVLARPDTTWYRTAKYLRRNRVAVAAAVLVAASLVAGAAVSLWQARRAERRFAQVRQLANHFLFDIHDEIQNTPGTTKAREKIVGIARDYLDSLAADSAGDPQLSTEVATAYVKVANIQGRPGAPNLGKPQDALRSYARAIAILENLQARGQSDRTRQRLLAEAYTLDAGLREFTSDRKGAIESAGKAIALADPWLANPPVSEQEYEVACAAYSSLADIRAGETDFKGAEKLYDKALEFARRSMQTYPSAETRRMLAHALDRAAFNLMLRGDLPGTLKLYQEEEPILQDLYRADPSTVSNKRGLVLLNQNMGNVYGSPDIANLMQPEKALDYYRKMAALADEMAAADPNDRTALMDKIRAAGKVLSLTRDSNPAASIPKYLEILEWAKAVPEGREKAFTRANVLSELAVAYTETRQFAEAHNCLRESGEWVRKLASNTVGNTDPESAMAVVYGYEGDLAVEERNWPAAHDFYQRVLQTAEKEYRDSPDDISSRYDLGNAYKGLEHLFVAQGNRTAAQEWIEKRRALWKDWNARFVPNPYSIAEMNR